MRMQRQSLSAALEGGFIEEYAWDLLGKSLMFRVDVLSGGALSSYRVQFLAVSSIEYQDEPTRPWERIEVTEIRVEEGPEQSPSEEWKIWINFWDSAELTLRCAAIRVEDEPLT
jgi:hypothetical protein